MWKSGLDSSHDLSRPKTGLNSHKVIEHFESRQVTQYLTSSNWLKNFNLSQSTFQKHSVKSCQFCEVTRFKSSRRILEIYMENFTTNQVNPHSGNAESSQLMRTWILCIAYSSVPNTHCCKIRGPCSISRLRRISFWTPLVLQTLRHTQASTLTREDLPPSTRFPR